MDGFNEIGKYLKQTKRRAELSLKREVAPQISIERIRDIFDSEHPVKADLTIPPAAKRILLDFNFGKKLPSLACCGDCLCGSTESYTSDSLINGSIYITQAYVPDSTTVYLNGIQATKGVEYLEANPTTGQIAILIPTSTIVVSYVYTVGNCTEAICVDDRFECLGYTFLSGLVTVFSDRFDRPAGGLETSGGCGYWFTTGATSPIVAPNIQGNGQAIIPATTQAWVGGVDRLVGKSVEVLAAVNVTDMPTAGQGNIITMRNDFYSASFQFIKTSATVMTIKITGMVRLFQYIDDPFNSIDQAFFTEHAFSIQTTIAHTGGRYWFRVAQIPGSWAMKAWPQFSPEPAGAQLTLQLSDSFVDVPTDPDEIDRQLIQPSVSKIQPFGSGWEAVMVGAGLDNGDWKLDSVSTGAVGHYCAEVPDSQVRFGYNCFPGNGQSTVTAANQVTPSLYWEASWPHFVGTPAGSGRIVEYDQTIAGWHLQDGHPGGFRVKGQLVASVYNSPITVQVKQFPTGPLTMGGINGIQGGNVVGSYILQPDGTPVDVDFFLAAGTDEYIRWGLHVENLQGFIAEQPFFSGAFLSPNNTGNVVEFYFLRAEAVQSAQCTAAPFCGDCDSTRCPPVYDGFTSDNATRDFGTTDFYRQPNDGLPSFNNKGTASKVEYTGGIMKTSFNASSQGFNELQYFGSFDCNWVNSSNIIEATFEMKLTTPTPSTESGSFEFGGWDSGPYIFFDLEHDGIIMESFDITPAIFSVNPISYGIWYNVRYRLDANQFFLKIWTGAEPSGWTFTGTADAPTKTFSFYTDTTFASGSSAFVSEVRNLNMAKVV